MRSLLAGLRPRRPHVRPADVQIYAAAALAAAGCTLGILLILDELAFHARGHAGAAAHMGVALAVGMALGLWFPRRVFLRRYVPSDPTRDFDPSRDRKGAGTPVRPELPNQPTDSRPHVHASADHTFAATVTGGLFVALAAAWLLGSLGAFRLESYRELLAQRLLLPGLLLWMLLWIPVYAALGAIAAVTTLAVVALHGWRRAAAWPRMHVARLWACILLGATAAALLPLSSQNPAASLAAAALLLAAAVACALPLRTGAVAAPPPFAPPAHPVSLSGRAAAALAAAGAGLAFGFCLSTEMASAASPATPVAWLAAAAACGIVAARFLLRTPYAGMGLSGGLLLVGLSLLVPLGERHAADAAGLVRLVIVTIPAALTIVHAGRRIGRGSRSLQLALAYTGAYVSGGFAAGLAISAIAPLASGALPAVLALATCAAALVLMFREAALGPAVRGALLAGVAGWALLALALRLQPPGGMPQDTSESLSGAPDLAAELLRILAEPDVRVYDWPAGGPWHAEAVLSAFDADLSGRSPAELVVVRCRPDAAHGDERRAAARAMRRFFSCKLRGGRIAVQLPPSAHDATAWRTIASSRTDAFELLVRSEDRESTLLFLGSDVPGWLASRRFSEDWEIDLRRPRAAGAN